MESNRKDKINEQPMFDFASEKSNSARIKVIGVGGGGGNAVSAMMDRCIDGVEFIVCNTDAQALKGSRVPIKSQIGGQLTKGLGAGANPEIGRKAAMEDSDSLTALLEGADMIFVTAGMGGGTGTGAAPVIANIAKSKGALTVGVVTKPFLFEGSRRMKYAETGLAELEKSVDALIVIPNQRLLNIADKKTAFLDSFNMANSVLANAVKGISDIITIPGLVNVDFADVQTIMSEMGQALMGTGYSNGENMAVDAALKAIHSPLLEDTSIDGARGILINVTGSPTLSSHDVHEASMEIQKNADPDANIIVGAVIDPNLKDEIYITVIATGFDQSTAKEYPKMMEKPRLEKTRLGSDDKKPTMGEKKDQKPMPEPQKRLGGDKYDLSQFHDELDIPAFIRRQAD